MPDSLTQGAADNFRRLIERNADAMLVIDSEGVVREANFAAEVLFRQPAGRLIGNHFGHPLVSGRKVEIEIVRGSETATAELRIVEVEWEGAPAYLASLRDLSERKRAAEALETARRDQLETKDRMLSQISHELRTPLAAAQEFVSLVLDEAFGPLNSQQREYLELADGNARRLGRLIDDLVELSRTMAGEAAIERKALDLPALVEACVRPLETAAAANAVELRTEVPETLPAAAGDERRTRQILLNLIDNAIKFTPEGGSILVSTRIDPEDPAFLRVSIADTGPGIDEDSLESIFGRLEQAHEGETHSRQGLGLGLYICRELAERQSGRVWVESGPEGGATFHLDLPRLARSL